VIDYLRSNGGIGTQRAGRAGHLRPDGPGEPRLPRGTARKIDAADRKKIIAASHARPVIIAESSRRRPGSRVDNATGALWNCELPRQSPHTNSADT